MIDMKKNYLLFLLCALFCACTAQPQATVEKPETEERGKPEMNEVRNSVEYIDAYAEYLKTGKDEECRALLSENATNGTVPVPEFVYDTVKTAWDREGITRRVRKAYINGNLKVGFEISATGAVVHTEGGAAVSEETLVLGVVNMVPKTIKKSIRDLIEISSPTAERKGRTGVKMTKAEKEKEIARLEKQMKEAARMMEYEYAAVLRDQIIELRGSL